MSGPEQDHPSEQSQSDRPKESAEPVAEAGSPPAPHSTAHESDLFPAGAGPNYFGTGRYGTGGSNAEGNDGIGEINPRGGYGSFTDAGGPGASTLYGEEAPVDVPEADDSDPPTADAGGSGS
jgi:hypothetical protein